MKRYFGRKLFVYILTFFLAVTIDWMIPRFMPGNPVDALMARAGSFAESSQLMHNYYSKLFGLDVPLWQQYLNFWSALLHGDLGISVYVFPMPVTKVIMNAVPFDILLLVPAILLSWFAGNKFGAFAARSKRLDNTILPLGYILTATPYNWLAMLLAWALGIVFKIFPISGGYSFSMTPTFSWNFIWSLLLHWFLPFASLFLVQFGGWAIGMRNMIIYELESDYSHYLEALGAPRKLVRKYAFNNAMLPQLTGLALQLGVIVAGALATEIVFSYPGIGYLILQAINSRDYFLLQGCFLFIILGVLLANFIIDIVYVLVDPRTRAGMQGEFGMMNLKKNELLYFALRNNKLKIGLIVFLFFVVLTFIGPLFTDYAPMEYIGPPSSPPSAEFWFGTTTFGQDVFTQFVYGLKSSFLVGIVGGGLGTLLGILVGFIAGYRGGLVDEFLNMLTNIVLVIPTLAVLLIIVAYLEVRGLFVESVFIGLTAWPWAAKAIRAQTFSLRSRDFVDLARLSGMKSMKIVFTVIAPNMMSYLLLVFILQFGGAILTAATLDFIGLGPTNAISLGLMMNNAVLWSALILGMWWWFIPPGIAITAIVGSLYVMNVGLDEVFNPKLREM